MSREWEGGGGHFSFFQHTNHDVTPRLHQHWVKCKL